MSRDDSDKERERNQRNAAAMRRLEELLRDPGPGITVRRVGSPLGDNYRDEAYLPPAPIGDTPPSPAPVPPVAPADGPPTAPPAPSREPPQPEPQPGTPLTRQPAPPRGPEPPVPVPDTRPTIDQLRARLATGYRPPAPAGPAPRDAGAVAPPSAPDHKPAVQPPAPPHQASQPAPRSEPAPVEASQPQPHRPAPQPQRTPPQQQAPQQQQQQPRPQPQQPQPSAGPETLRHLPEGARGRLASFLEGDKSPPPPIPAPQPAAAKPASPSAGLATAKPVLSKDSELRQAIAASRRPIIAAGAFSFVINILMLAGPLFMLQVYDRVMTSGSIPTLVALSLMTAGIYAIIGVLELVRSRVVTRVGVEVDQRIGDRVFKAALRRGLLNPGTSSSALRDLETLRQFLASPGLLSFFDAPWTPVYLLVIFMVHWALGLTALIGAVLLLTVTWMSETRTRGPLAEANLAAAKCVELSETGQRNAESLTAMGMIGAYRSRWQTANREALAWQVLSADKIGSMSALTKTLRLLGQSLMLGLGAYLALHGDISSGSIIAGTIIFGRALAPVEQAIGHWRGFLKARECYEKVEKLLAQEPEPPQRTTLPAPKGRLVVQGLRVAAPDSRQLILSNVALVLEPGQLLAVIGPSASGKSTLARTIVGLWPPFSGTISLDGARLDQWDPEALGRHVGFLPQTVELFAGTVKENISRFTVDASDAEVVSAATQAHAHEMIMALPKGYDTELGNFGTYLSSGQRQRIGLARALFRNPSLVVLDEPNANLDRAGDEALSNAIDGMRSRGQAIVLVSHRVQAIGKADLLLYLDRGVQRAFGPRREVMKLFQAGMDPREQPAPQQAAAVAGRDGGRAGP